MTESPLVRVLVLLVLAVGVLALSGCEASFSTGGGVSSEEVAEEAQKQLSKVAEENGQPPFPKVTCPDELEEKIGSTTNCFATVDGSKQEIHVRVTGKSGDHVHLHFSTGGIAPDVIAEEAQKQLDRVSEEEGQPPFPKIACPDEIEEEVGSSTTCYSTFDGSKHKIHVTVTNRSEGHVHLDFTSEGRPTS